MNERNYDQLKLENQLCFPRYAAAREVMNRYRPFLDELDITYTQYVTMMVLWERKRATVGELGECLFLDSGTLTPLLKKLEAKELVTRTRSKEDERSLIVEITEKGMALRERAAEIPEKIAGCISLKPEEAGTMYRLLYKLLGKSEEVKS